MKGQKLQYLLLLLIVAQSVASAQTFLNPLRIPTGTDPKQTFLVDLNGDGLPDFIYPTSGLNTTPGEQKTLLGQPDGSYLPGPSFTRPLSVGACRPADLNHDGKPDLACLSYIDDTAYQAVSYLGNGDGSFSGPIYSAVMRSTCIFTKFYPSLYTPVDLNGDGLQDLVVGDGLNWEAFVLINVGNGRFVQSAQPTGYFQGGEVFATDLNGDGKMDLFSASGPEIFLGDGTGGFTELINYSSYWTCMLHDMDGDGHPDAVCVTPVAPNGYDTGTMTLSILKGNADGSFNLKTPLMSVNYGNPRGGLAAIDSPYDARDLNGDGILDLVGWSSDGFTVLMGQPGLKYADPVHYSVGEGISTGGTGGVLYDLNHDGHVDVVSAGPLGFYVAYGRKDGTFQAPRAIPVANLLGQVTYADFNGDGVPDAVATGDKALELSLGNGDGSFKPFTALASGNVTYDQSIGQQYQPIVHGDFRGLGRQDILSFGNSGVNYLGPYKTYVHLNNGDGTFQEPAALSNLNNNWTGQQLSTIADFNKDGKDDILAIDSEYSGNSHFEVYLSGGDGSFSPVESVIPGAIAGTGGDLVSKPVIADFDRDGYPDVAYAEGRYLYLMKGKGNGSLSLLSSVPIPAYPRVGAGSYLPLDMAAGDFDGDGNLDIALLAKMGVDSNYTTVFAVYVFYGDGKGGFSQPVTTGPLSAAYSRLRTADVDKDGRTDLVLQFVNDPSSIFLYAEPTVAVIPSLPGRLFGAEAIYTGGQQANDLQIVDLNRDGYPDLLVSNGSYFNDGYTTAATNSVTPLMNLGPGSGSALPATTTTVSSSATSIGAGSAVTFTATVTGTSSMTPPTGTIRFADQSGVVSTVNLSASGAKSATATLTTSQLAAGTDTMSAAYSGDAANAPSLGVATENISNFATATSVSLSPTTILSGDTVLLNATISNQQSSALVPTGYVNFRDGSTIVAGGVAVYSPGVASISVSLTGAAGMHTITADYGGDWSHAGSTSSTTIDIQSTPTVTIAPLWQVIGLGQTASYTITVNGASGLPTPGGVVVLSTTGYSSGQVNLIAGSATVTIPANALAVGNYSLQAAYTPDAASSVYYTKGTTQSWANLVVAKTPPGFTITGSAISAPRASSSMSTGSIIVQPVSYFTGSVNLTAAITSSPSGALYPPTVLLQSSSVSLLSSNPVYVTLQVAAITASTNPQPPSSPLARGLGGGGAVLSLALAILIPRRRKVRNGLVWLLLGGLLGSGVACSGGSGSHGTPGTTPGVYTVTITGVSGAITSSGTVTVTVL